MQDADWRAIDDLLMRLACAAGSAVTPAFRASLDDDLARLAPDPRVRRALLALVERPPSR